MARTPKTILRDAGKAMYGPRFQVALAESLETPDRPISKPLLNLMLSGKRTISPAVLRKLSYVLQRESAVLIERAAIAKRISREIDAQLKENE